MGEVSPDEATEEGILMMATGQERGNNTAEE